MASDPGLRDSNSLLLAGVRSVLCVPLKDREQAVCGFIYAEHSGETGCLGQADLLRVTSFARDLERRLAGGGSSWQTPAPLVKPTRTGVRVASSGTPTGPARSHRLDDRALVVMLRSLHSMLTAGVPMGRSLNVLSAQAASEAEREVAALALRQVEQGNPLSTALHRASPSFTPFHLRLLRVGESSGALVEVLDTLAGYEERRRAFALRLRSSLAYPCMLFLICCAVLLVGPPAMMSGLRGLFAQLGGDLPASARFMLKLGAFLSSPWTLTGLALALVLAVLGLRTMLRNPSGRLLLRRLAAPVPALGVLLQRLAVVRFCEALALQLRVGISVLEALEHSLLAANDPLLELGGKASQRLLRDGEELSAALAAADYFPSSVLQLLAAGEESGRVSDILAWVARIQRLELEASLEMLLAAMEPAMIMTMGIVACGVAWVVLEPMVSVVGKL